MAEKIVVALGGNALQSGKAEPTAEAQLAVVKETCERIADLSEKGYEVAVVHGNGPQVGRILLASETAKNVTPAMPFDVCGAMSQGYIGYHLQQALKFALKKRGKRHHCAVNGVQRKIPYHKRKIQKTKQAAKPTVRIPKTSIAGESSSNSR